MAQENIKLNFINKSNDTNSSNIVIFQKNVATDFNEFATAWKVIKNIPGDVQSFKYPQHTDISTSKDKTLTTPSVDTKNKKTSQSTPKLYIGVVSQMDEGKEINSDLLSSISTELDLTNVQSADIIMTGGGPGASSTTFSFTLENINN